MPLEGKQSRFASDQVINKVLYPDDTVSLGVNDQVVRASTVSANNAFTITLPGIVEAAGRFYSLFMVARNSSDDITIQDKADDTQVNGSGGLADITFNLALDRVLLYSDGFVWHTVTSAGL